MPPPPRSGRRRGPGGESSATVPAIRSKSSLSRAIRQDRRAALVVNTRSRRGQRLYPAVRARLDAAGFDLLGSFPASRPGELGASLAAAIDLRPDLLIVGAATAASARPRTAWPTATWPLVTATLRHVISGARRSMAEPAFLAVSELWLDTDPPLPLDVDGEIRGTTPTRIVLAPNALRVMVTPDFPGT